MWLGVKGVFGSNLGEINYGPAKIVPGWTNLKVIESIQGLIPQVYNIGYPLSIEILTPSITV